METALFGAVKPGPELGAADVTDAAMETALFGAVKLPVLNDDLRLSHKAAMETALFGAVKLSI